jgi:ADP-Ribosyltransferase in polyvalent proteins
MSKSTLMNGSQGTPLIVYHGTGDGEFCEFNRIAWKTAYGHFFTDDKNSAEFYTHGSNPKVFEANLSVSRVLQLDSIVEDGYGIPDDLRPWIDSEFGSESDFMDWLGGADLYKKDKGYTQNSLMGEAEGLGYDCVVFFDARGGGGVSKSYVVFENESIKFI